MHLAIRLTLGLGAAAPLTGALQIVKETLYARTAPISSLYVSGKVSNPPQEMKLLVNTGGNTTRMNSVNSDIRPNRIMQGRYGGGWGWSRSGHAASGCRAADPTPGPRVKKEKRGIGSGICSVWRWVGLGGVLNSLWTCVCCEASPIYQEGDFRSFQELKTLSGDLKDVSVV